jgi:hypothetical protein
MQRHLFYGPLLKKSCNVDKEVVRPLRRCLKLDSWASKRWRRRERWSVAFHGLEKMRGGIQHGTEGSGAVCPQPPDGRGPGADRKGIVAGRGVWPGTTSPASLKGLTSSSGPPPSWRQSRWLFLRSLALKICRTACRAFSSYRAPLGSRRSRRRKTPWGGKGRPEMACAWPPPKPSRFSPRRHRTDVRAKACKLQELSEWAWLWTILVVIIRYNLSRHGLSELIGHLVKMCN